MTEVNRRLKEKRSAGGEESGFTLIELLIVIVVLGILAAIVVFALNGVTGKSLTAACQSDAKTVDVAVAALQAENPGVYANYTSAQWQTNLTNNSTVGAKLTGGPFLHSWPQGNVKSYTITVSPNTNVALTGNTGITPANGDVIVTPQAGAAKGNTYDATQVPAGNTAGCANL